MHSEAAEEKAEEPAAKPVKEGEVIYHSLQPPFVVNFSGNATARFLQVGIDVSTRDESVVEDLEKHNPVIRNNIVMLLSTQDQATLMTREGKEKLRADVQAEIQRILKEHTGRTGVESVYFTSFVMQ
jgi:flagellar FliL protein